MRIAKIIQTYTIILAVILVFITTTHAATTLEVGIPGTDALPGSAAPSVPMYIKYLYYFVLGLVGIAGFSSLVFWGTVWAGSGVVDKKAQAIAGIKNTLTGIGIALTAFIILTTINPDLIVIKAPGIATVDIESQDIGMTPRQIKYQDNRNFCGQFNMSMCLSPEGGGKMGCGIIDGGNGKICVPKEVVACNKHTEAYKNCKSGDIPQCQEQKILDCAKDTASCVWSGNLCWYNPK